MTIAAGNKGTRGAPGVTWCPGDVYDKELCDYRLGCYASLDARFPPLGDAACRSH